MNRRNLLKSSSLLLATSPLAFAASKIGGNPVPTGKMTLTLNEALAFMYTSAQNNSFASNEVAQSLGVVNAAFAQWEDQGLIAKIQTAWPPKNLVWTDTDSNQMIALMAGIGIAVDPSIYRNTDILIQTERDKFPATVLSVVSGMTARLQSAAALSTHALFIEECSWNAVIADIDAAASVAAFFLEVALAAAFASLAAIATALKSHNVSCQGWGGGLPW
jgi:hypothetical protein